MACINLDSPHKNISEGGGLYIHIPYCHSKCIYCDFVSGSCSPGETSRLCDALLEELSERIDELPRPLRTLYIGGGTPSILSTDEIQHLSEEIRAIAYETGALVNMSALSEFTIEVNPEDVCEEKIKAWQEAGVNRVSMGIQSLQDNELRFLRRCHSASEAVKSANMLRDAFDNVSFDIMFGIPGQTEDSLADTCRRLIQLQPDHISAYSLMYEEGTPLTVMRNRGDFSEIDDETSVRMYMQLSELLRQNGYLQYEISNYARRWMESIHNSSYWSFRPYLGLGPSAHSYNGMHTRRWNRSSVKAYLRRFSECETDAKDSTEPFYEEEILSAEEQNEEYIMLRLRTRDGIDVEQYRQRFGEKRAEILLTESLRPDSGLKHENGRIRLLRESLMRSDSIILKLVENTEK